MNVETGERLRLPGGRLTADSVAISQDGRRAIWLEPIGVKAFRGRVTVTSLGRKPRSQATAIFASRSDEITLSSDGSQIAIMSGRIVTVLDLESERALASARIPGERSVFRRMFFVQPNLIRLYDKATNKTLKIYEFDVQSRKLEETGSIDAAECFHHSIPSADALALRFPGTGLIQLRDGRTGRILVAAAKSKTQQSMMGFLADGRFVIAGVTDGQARLSIFSSDGMMEQTIELGPAGSLRLGGEPERGSLVVATSREDRAVGPRDYRKTLTVLLVGLESGKIKQVGSQMSPLSYLWWYTGHLPTPGSVATRLFITADHQLVYLDPIAGQRRVIAGRGAEL